MNESSTHFTIGALAQRCDLGVETIRDYQRRGLLAEPDRPCGGIRRYGAAGVARVRFVRRAQQLSFNLEQAAE